MINQIQPSISLANHCVNRLMQGTPKIAGAYDLPKDSNSTPIKGASYKPPAISESRNIDYRDPEGNPCTVHEASRYLGLGCTQVCALFGSTRNWRTIYKHHGINRKCIDYKDANGNKIAPSALAKIYGCSPPTVSRLFAKHDGDYIPAIKDLQAFKERAEAKAGKKK